MNKVALSAGIAFSALSAISMARAENATAPVVVEADRILPPNHIVLDPHSPRLPPARDAGETLRTIPGVAGSRMGGHGIDPVIRGQKNTQLNVIADGAFVHGGCPNRMDPPSATANLELVDRVVVTKGYQSVANGPGATGGTIRLERDPPSLSAANPFAIRSGAGYVSNGAMRDAWTDMAAGTRQAYVRGGGKWKDSGNYTDGNDHKVRSAFTQFGGFLETGWTPRDSLVALGYEYNKTEDALFAGTGMDAPLDETDTLRLKLERRNLDAGALTGVRVDAYGSWLDHTMDNYSLRPSAATRMAVESDSDTYGGRAAADLRAGAVELAVGVDVQVNNREAWRYARAGSAVDLASPAYLESLAWPDITVAQYGLFAEGMIPTGAESRLKLGGRYDRVEVDYGAADQSTRMNAGTYRTANDLYAAYYGERAGDRAENNLGGLLRYERDVGATTWFAGLSRAVRTADATERGIAMKPMGANRAWVGNPNIVPEAHHQMDAGVETNRRNWSASASVFGDRVSDFILRDSARGQDGIRRADLAAVYRNVDALLAGFEAAGRVRLGGNWEAGADMAYTYAENLDDGGAIAQIPPLNGSVSLAYAPEEWSLGGRLRWAATQTRADSFIGTGSGQDAGKTSGYGVVDLFGQWQPVAGLTVDGGVTNLFDKAYAEHLNRASAFDPTVAQVNEPGRSFYMRGRVAF